jgi:hypothetical protein
MARTASCRSPAVTCARIHKTVKDEEKHLLQYHFADETVYCSRSVFLCRKRSPKIRSGFDFVQKIRSFYFVMFIQGEAQDAEADFLIFYVTDGNIMYLTDASRFLISCVIQHYAPVVVWGGWRNRCIMLIMTLDPSWRQTLRLPPLGIEPGSHAL